MSSQVARLRPAGNGARQGRGKRKDE